MPAPWPVGDPPPEWRERLRREGTRTRIVRPEGSVVAASPTSFAIEPRNDGSAVKPPESPPALVFAESGEPRILEAALRLDRDGVAASWLVGDPPREWWDRLRREGTRTRIVRPEGSVFAASPTSFALAP